MNTSVENYFVNGCMRCSYGGTTNCKVHKWTNELVLLREIINQSRVVEECKWGVPCYTYNGSNILTLSALKDHCTIGFFKGSLLNDEKALLEKPGPRSQAVRVLNFSNEEQILSLKEDVLDLISAAVNVEKQGLKVKLSKKAEDYPEELLNIFNEDSLFKSAFEELTPGRQRGYIIHFNQAKQAKTRISRIQKCIPKILNGEGLNDKYKSRKK